MYSDLPASKRRCEESLHDLCRSQQWVEVKHRILMKPEQACMTSQDGSTPLALACRLGAPVDCIKAILDAAPHKVRNLLSSRGTPLHEAVICEAISLEAFKVLLQVDESLEGTRATVMQDLDGHTPLHLLIRRRTPCHILMENDTFWMQFFDLLVQSCPEAVGIPDNGEYEEPPLVFALKANQYAATTADVEFDDIILPRIESSIYKMVEIMLNYYPEAASKVFKGARGQYTALHSAVFHGRCSKTIDLILQAERKISTASKSALLANTQGEIPLHFAAMRGEPPRSIALLGSAAPTAILYRDTSGLTPAHWLWIRFVSSVVSLDDRQLIGAIELEPRALHRDEICSYSKFWYVERGDFVTDLILMRKVDPPLDFFRMRHIPSELYERKYSKRIWAKRAIYVLSSMRDRDRENGYMNGRIEGVKWTREEIVSCLFWVKIVSLLKAVASVNNVQPSNHFKLVHTAMATSSCPSSVAYIASLLFPEELCIADDNGCFPLHYAAKREWYSYDWRNEENDSAASKLLEEESLDVLNFAIEASPDALFSYTDKSRRLVLHHVIDTFVKACSKCRSVCSPNITLISMLDTLKELLRMNPESLERRDGETKLYPFLQATALATAYFQDSSQNLHDELPLTISFTLLRENPSLLSSANLTLDK